jgi:hypothetical protein
MVSRYPHTAIISWKDEPIKDEGTGNYTEGKQRSITVQGRLEPASSTSKASILSEGRTLNYSYKFICGLITDKVPVSAIIDVLSQKRKLIQLHNYQTYCEIWL